MALCTASDGLAYVSVLRVDNDSVTTNNSLEQLANESSDNITELLIRRGYLAEGDDPETTLDPAQLLIAKHLASADLGQNIMSARAEAIDPRLLGVREKQKQFTLFAFGELKFGRYYPIFNPTKYSSLIGGASTIPLTKPTYSSTEYATVTLVKYLCPGWTPDSANQVSTTNCQNWINRLTIDVYALALTRGNYDLVDLTLKQARNLGKIVNVGVAALVLQANAFGDSQQQVSITAYEKIKDYYKLRTLLIQGKLD